VDELSKFLETEVPELARKHGQTKEEKEQSHHALGSRLNHFVLTRNPAVAARMQERVEKFAKLAKDENLGATMTEEGKRLLERMPRLKAHQELRKQYQKLVDGDQKVTAFLTERTRIYGEMKLKRIEATGYAAKVMQGVRVVHENYVKELNKGEMVGWAVRGLYRRAEEKKIPQDIKRQLDRCKELDEEDLIRLLADVREQLGKREDLTENKDVDMSLLMMTSHL